MAVDLRVLDGGSDWKRDEADVTALGFMDYAGSEADDLIQIAEVIRKRLERLQRRATEGRIEYTGLRRRATDWTGGEAA